MLLAGANILIYKGTSFLWKEQKKGKKCLSWCLDEKNMPTFAHTIAPAWAGALWQQLLCKSIGYEAAHRLSFVVLLVGTPDVCIAEVGVFPCLCSCLCQLWLGRLV